ncbi:biotin synthase BioB, partial [Streptomyces sp. SMC 277]|nr:biotin synthase BioB [Streptomyces antimicrobicus]
CRCWTPGRRRGCGSHAAQDGPAEEPVAARTATEAPAQAAPGEVRPELVAVRRRGAGTDLAPNA